MVVTNITQWIHFEELGGDPWILPIYAAANAAVEKKKYAGLSPATHALGLHVSTRLNVVPRVIARLNLNCGLVYDKVKEHEPVHIFDAGTDGYGFRLDPGLKYLVIADINSFLFEVNACADLITEFAQALYNHVGRPSEKEDVLKHIKGAYKQAMIDPKWFTLLDANRNFVAHNGTPYIAVDITTPERPALLIMKDNIVAFNDPDTFFTIADLQLISTGFTQTNALLQQLLIGLFK